MKRKTYNNVLKGAKMIQALGYDFDEAAEIAVSIFDNMEATKNGMSFEWHTQFIAPKADTTTNTTTNTTTTTKGETTMKNTAYTPITVKRSYIDIETREVFTLADLREMFASDDEREGLTFAEWLRVRTTAENGTLEECITFEKAQDILVGLKNAYNTPEETVAAFVEGYGYENAVAVIATMVDIDNWDGRFSEENIDWAHTHAMAYDLARDFTTSRIHRAHLNQIADAMRNYTPDTDDTTPTEDTTTEERKETPEMTTNTTRPLSVSALTSDTLYTLAEMLMGDRYANLLFEDGEASDIEHAAYVANMSENSKEAAWVRFCELLANGERYGFHHISDALAKRLADATEKEEKRFRLGIYDENGELDEDAVTEYATAEEAIKAADAIIADAIAEGNDDTIVAVADIETEETVYQVAAETFYDVDGVVDVDTLDEALDEFAERIEDDGDAFDEMLDECYGDIEVCGYTYSASEVFQKVDPVAYRCSCSDWADGERREMEYELDRADIDEECFRYGVSITRRLRPAVQVEYIPAPEKIPTDDELAEAEEGYLAMAYDISGESVGGETFADLDDATKWAYGHASSYVDGAVTAEVTDTSTGLSVYNFASMVFCLNGGEWYTLPEMKERVVEHLTTTLDEFDQVLDGLFNDATYYGQTFHASAVLSALAPALYTEKACEWAEAVASDFSEWALRVAGLGTGGIYESHGMVIKAERAG